MFSSSWSVVIFCLFCVFRKVVQVSSGGQHTVLLVVDKWWPYIIELQQFSFNQLSIFVPMCWHFVFVRKSWVIFYLGSQTPYNHRILFHFVLLVCRLDYAKLIQVKMGSWSTSFLLRAALSDAITLMLTFFSLSSNTVILKGLLF